MAEEFIFRTFCKTRKLCFISGGQGKAFLPALFGPDQSAIRAEIK
jgi:hypothetical protein